MPENDLPKVRLSERFIKSPDARAAMQAAALRLSFKKKEIAASREEWRPHPYQMPPGGIDGDWEVYGLRGGRGIGKTKTGANLVREHIEAHHGKPFSFTDHNGEEQRGIHRCRIGVGAPTIADVRDTCFEGETGIVNEFGAALKWYNRSLQEAVTLDGARIKGIGSEQPERWNGPQWCFLWWDELALSNKASFDQSLFGLRLFAAPKLIYTTTPKRKKWLQELESEPGVVVRTATTYDNPSLTPSVKARLERKYGGTALGRQELEGKFSFEVEGALWKPEWIDDNRRDMGPTYERVVVAIDPAVSQNSDSAQTGIAVAALGSDGDFYVMNISGYKLSPHGWASKAIMLYDEFMADRVIGEVNNGGDLVEATIRGVNVDRYIPFKAVRASRGKAVRAEPIASLYEQGKVHHVGIFPDAEDQMCAFPVANEYADQVDAIVWALTELSGEGMGPAVNPDYVLEQDKGRPHLAGIRDRQF